MSSNETVPGMVYYWGNYGLRVWLAEDLRRARAPDDKTAPRMSLTGDDFCDVLMLNCSVTVMCSKGELLIFPYVTSDGLVPFLYSAKLLQNVCVNDETGPVIVLRLSDGIDADTDYENLVFYDGETRRKVDSMDALF